MQLRAKLASVDGKAPTAQDGPRKIGLKFAPMFLGDQDASWLFEHLGDYLNLDIYPGVPPPTPMEEAIAEAEVRVPSGGRRRNGTRSSEQA